MVIAHGYNNIAKVMPPTNTTAQQVWGCESVRVWGCEGVRVRLWGVDGSVSDDVRGVVMVDGVRWCSECGVISEVCEVMVKGVMVFGKVAEDEEWGVRMIVHRVEPLVECVGWWAVVME